MAVPISHDPYSRRGTRKRSKRKKGPPFVAIFWEMMDSSAWECLGNPARVAYLHIKRKMVSSNPGDLSLTYDEMGRVMERRTFKNALDELEKFKFITWEKKGGLFRQTNLFRLCEGWRQVTRPSRPSRGINDTVDSMQNATVGDEKKI